MEHLTTRQAARIAGIGYVVIFILAIFANFAVFEAFYVPGDAAATSSNVLAKEGLWRAGILAFLIVTITDIVIGWALYVLLRPRNESLASLAMLLRVANAILFAAALPFLYRALSAARLGLAEQALLNVETFHLTWMVALVGFGAHLLVLASLLYKRSKTQTVLAGLLALAGLAYILDTSLLIMLPSYGQWASTMLAIVAVPGVIGELGFTIWILAKGFGPRDDALQ